MKNFKDDIIVTAEDLIEDQFKGLKLELET